VVLDYRAIGKRQGVGRLFLDGVEVVPETEMSPTMVRMPSEGIDIGIDRRQPASRNYAKFGAFRYSNDIAFVRILPGAQAPGTISNMSEVEAQRIALE
jgi:hypothetical protein